MASPRGGATGAEEPPRKAKGTIADVFVNLGAAAEHGNPRIAQLKRELAPDPAVLQRSWARLIATIEHKSALLRSSGMPAVPSVSMDDIVGNGGRVPLEAAAAARRAGVVVLRNVVPRAEAERWKSELEGYLEANKHGVVGYPESKPVVFECYWSKPQVAARQHPRTVAAVEAMNALWHSSDGQVDFGTPRMYVDRCRIRPPGDASFALAPHVDNGSLERWEDPQYRRIYRRVLDGAWELFDPFDGDGRDGVTMDMHNSPNACSFFRTFQGWLSLTDTGPGEGTLQVFPFLRESIAYYMMRPLLPDAPADVLCGAAAGKSQEITEQWHPHLRRGMVSVPRVAPGDVVFWHCDAIHAVDAKHGGTGDSAVFFIPAGVASASNDRYLERQWRHFAAGKTPPDFPANDCEVAFAGRAVEGDVSALGRRVLGGAGVGKGGPVVKARL